MKVELEKRLQIVADQIKSKIHADIGSDHGYLPKYLLDEKRIESAIVVEKNKVPYDKAKFSLKWHENATVLLGDGFEPIAEMVDSVSITGMGAKLIAEILSAHPEKVPNKLVLQPNDSAEPIRRWAFQNGFHISHEELAEGHWLYEVLVFEKSIGVDPAYETLGELGFIFGPLLLGGKNPLLKNSLEQNLLYFSKKISGSKPEVLVKKVELIRKAIALF